MLVSELIEKLSKMPQDVPVYMSVTRNDGCDTCGWDATVDNELIGGVHDLQTKVILD